MERSNVAILIPAFNECATISKVIKEALKYGEVIVVNDCSKDDTSKISLESGAVVLDHNFQKGYDQALNTGFNYACKEKYLALVTLDADGQHDPKLIPEFINGIAIGYDLVVGNRCKKARFAENIFSLYTKIFWNISDPLCGLKAYKIKSFKKLGHFDSYNSIGTELLLFALKSGLKVCETNISTKPRKGKPRFGSVINSNYKILRSLGLSFFYN